MIAAFDYRFARFSRELDLRAAFLHAIERANNRLIESFTKGA